MRTTHAQILYIRRFLSRYPPFVYFVHAFYRKQFTCTTGSRHFKHWELKLQLKSNCVEETIGAVVFVCLFFFVVFCSCQLTLSQSSVMISNEKVVWKLWRWELTILMFEGYSLSDLSRHFHHIPRRHIFTWHGTQLLLLVNTLDTYYLKHLLSQTLITQTTA